MNYQHKTYLENRLPKVTGGFQPTSLLKKRADQVLSFTHQYPCLHFHLLEDLGENIFKCKETERLFRYNKVLRVWYPIPSSKQEQDIS
jgi:hypothetical protein